jgi:MtN3 and saliva related transmembrane protein
MIVDLIGYVAGIIAMISFLPQVIKTFRSKKADDISVHMLVLTLTTNILYIIYGIFLGLYPIIIMLSIMTVIVLFQVVLTFKYKTN